MKRPLQACELGAARAQLTRMTIADEQVALKFARLRELEDEIYDLLHELRFDHDVIHLGICDLTIRENPEYRDLYEKYYEGKA